MSTNLQHRALRSESESQSLDDHPRFTSMVVPIDRTTRDRDAIELPTIELQSVVRHGVRPHQGGPVWLSIMATVLTGLLLIPVLIVALFPVSILALACAPLAAVFFGAMFGFRREDRSRRAEPKTDSVQVSRAA
jgi:hypothetical protein